MICTPPTDDTHAHLNEDLTTPRCQPYFPPPEESNENTGETPLTTTLLFDFMSGKGMNNKADLKHFAKLLGGIMMNGLPMLGLDDFVHASDFVNQNLHSKAQEEITKSPILSGQFGNFLNVRNLQIRLSPNNCWTNAFAKYLRQTSTIIKVRERQRERETERETERQRETDPFIAYHSTPPFRAKLLKSKSSNQCIEQLDHRIVVRKSGCILKSLTKMASVQ
jgi:hypothetical protein